MSAEPLRKESETGTDEAPATKAPVTTLPVAEAAEKPAAERAKAPVQEARKEVHKNPVRQSVEEICKLLGDSHEIRQEVMARGVQFNTLNVLIDYGTQNKDEEKADLIESTVSAAKKEFGDAGIGKEQLEKHLAALVTIERDIGHVRRLSQNQGMQMQALNFLTQMIRTNPGDGGEKAINSFVAYAIACDIKLDNFQEEVTKLVAGTGSVLPVIPRAEKSSAKFELKDLIRDVLLGLAVSVGILWLVL